MIVYEVTLEVEARLAASVESYMCDKHIPEILATGAFRTIRFERRGPTRFRTRYEAATREEVDRYLETHTERFRADFLAHFPEGCEAQRAVWEEIQRFGQ